MIKKYKEFLNEDITVEKWNETSDILVNEYDMDPQEAYSAIQDFMMGEPDNENSNKSSDRSDGLDAKELAKCVWEESQEK